MSSRSEKLSSVLRTATGDSAAVALPRDAGIEVSVSQSDGSADGSRKSARPGVVLVANDDRTVISRQSPGSDVAPPIPVGPLDCRTILPGVTLDHFRLDTYVGGGGMGAVFRGLDNRLNREVAVKVLSRDQADPETIRRFQNEAQNTARLDHPNIARVYYIGEDKGWNFIVFEFIEGENLRDRIESRGPLSIEEAISFTLQITEALDHAQRRDVVHRDIKPSNVLVTPQGMVKLVDMGLARLHQVNAPADDLTASGVTLGTFDYISPEQARDPRAADVRSDIYSLGCTLYYMLAGRPPFPQGTPLQKLLWHTGEEPPDIRLYRPDCPEAIYALVGRMMAKRPEQRFQSAAELVDRIVQLSKHLPWQREAGSSSAQRRPISAEQAWTGGWQAYVPFAVALVLMLLMALWPDDLSNHPVAGQKLVLPVFRPASTVTQSGDPVPEMKNSVPVSRDSSAAKTVAAVDTGNGKSRIEVAKSVKPAAAPEKADVQSGAGKDVNPLIASRPKIDEEENSTPSALPVDDAKTTPRVQSEPATKPLPLVRVVLPSTAETPVDSTIAATVSSLREALQFASLHPEVKTIELAFNEPHTIPDALDWAGPQIEIRGATGFQPRLIYRPDRSLPLFRLTSPEAALRIEQVQIEVFPPANFSGAAVLEAHARSSFEMQQCVVTVVEPAGWMAGLSRVAIFECLPADEAISATPAAEDAGESFPTRIAVRNSIVRGTATLVRVREELPLRISLQDAFIAVKHRLLETGGSLQKPRWMDRIRFAAQQCTLVCDDGIFMAGNQGAVSHRMETRLSVTAGIVVTRRGSPLIEYRGGETGDETKLSFEGDSNFYPRTQIFLRRVVPQDGQEATYDTALGDLPRWAADRNAEQGQLAVASPELPFHELLPSDFILRSPIDARAGCPLALLPSPETIRRSSVVNATNMGTSRVEMPETLMPPTMEPVNRPAVETPK